MKDNHRKILCRLVVIILLSMVFSGCVVVEKIDSLNGILEPPVPDYEVAELRKAEEAFFRQDFKKAKKIFSSVKKKSKKKIYKNYAAYGLACIKLLNADTLGEYNRAVGSLDGWKNSGTQVSGFRESPQMLILALGSKSNLMKSELGANYVPRKEDAEIMKKQQEEIKHLEETIKKLEHQISVLEAIDQEIQEKRNPI